MSQGIFLQKWFLSYGTIYYKIITEINILKYKKVISFDSMETLCQVLCFSVIIATLGGAIIAYVRK